jgi:hypothetical protein
MANFEQLAIGGLDYYSESEPTGAKSEELWLQYNSIQEVSFDNTKTTGLSTEQTYSNHDGSSSLIDLSYYQGVVYSGGYDDTLIATDVSDGSELWRVTIPITINTIETGNNLVFVGDTADRNWAFDSSDGSEIWRVSHHDSDLYDQSYDREKNVLYSTGVNKTIAIDVTDGSLMWEHTGMSERGYAIDHDNNEYVIVGDGSGAIWSLNKSDGSVNWNITPFQNGVESLVVDSGYIYSGDYYDTKKFNADTSNELWSTAFQGYQMVKVNELLIVGDIGTQKGFDISDGSELWSDTELNERELVSYKTDVYTIDSQSPGNVLKLGIEGLTDSDITETTLSVANGDLHINYNGTWIPHQ